ncbi:nitroreductase family protein [Segnochrobactrum spirostomi]|uniref:Putative NAD(P)H nitroreductase n=1 Tax=Segnochrobactrum spirostomi TaxID=2608987 RepID=A0A6A7XYE2_9HYPH|nr:nitroreductase [Segnochrobactrum spirostomi]MQT11423.1 nitroreductase [Segnochrobactrum spirostomi]
MTDLIAYLKTRRSIPALQLAAPAPEGEELLSILTIAARVPDHGKLAPWRFVLYRGEGAVAAGERLAVHGARRFPEATEEMIRAEKTRFTRAPLVVGVFSRAAPHPKIPEWEQVLSAGAVCLNLLHAVNAHGYAGVWLTEWPAYDAEAAKLLGAAEGEKVAGFVHIGTPTQPPFERDRPNVPSLITEYQ